MESSRKWKSNEMRIFPLRATTDLEINRRTLWSKIFYTTDSFWIRFFNIKNIYVSDYIDNIMKTFIFYISIASLRCDSRLARRKNNIDVVQPKQNIWWKYCIKYSSQSPYFICQDLISLIKSWWASWASLSSYIPVVNVTRGIVVGVNKTLHNFYGLLLFGLYTDSARDNHQFHL